MKTLLQFQTNQEAINAFGRFTPAEWALTVLAAFAIAMMLYAYGRKLYRDKLRGNSKY